jgi:hypothetical protein
MVGYETPKKERKKHLCNFSLILPVVIQLPLVITTKMSVHISFCAIRIQESEKVHFVILRSRMASRACSLVLTGTLSGPSNASPITPLLNIAFNCVTFQIKKQRQ